MADDKLKDKEILDLISKQPVDPSVLNKDIKIVDKRNMESPETGGMTAFVRKSKPSEINVVLPQGMGAAGLAHEVEHVTGSKAQRYGKERTDIFGSLLQDVYGPNSGIENAETFRKQMGKNPQMSEYIRKNYKVNPAYLFKQDTNLEEYISDLSSIEQMSNKDITKDPVIFKAIFFNDPKLAEAYRSVVGFRTERMDAKDLPPFTMQSVNKPSANQQTIKYLKGMFGF